MEKTTALCRWRVAPSPTSSKWTGIGRDNAVEVAAGGCDVLVMGSAVFGASCPAELLREVRSDLAEVMSRA